jgi:hypothetical protein
LNEARVSVIKTLYSVNSLPVFQNRMFDTEIEAKACTRGDVVVGQDLRTGLISNRAFRSELMQYDSNYQNEQAVSAVFREHLDQVASILGAHFAGQTLIEVGCGKGYFLEKLQGLGFPITGLDPTYEGSNPAIVKEYFTSESGLTADGIVLRHVLEHVEDPFAFLLRIAHANGGRGRIYIEVPCFDWICEHRAWFDIFYEHVNYFRLEDFGRLFGTVHASGRLFGGQYLYVVADLATLRVPVHSGEAFEFPRDFLATVQMHAARLRQRSAPAAVWGGASKGVLFSLFMQNAGAAVDMVVDINPAKHGKYLPATGLQVRAPDEALRLLAPGADVFVMNGRYADEIRKLTGDRFNYVTVDHATI